MVRVSDAMKHGHIWPREKDRYPTMANACMQILFRGEPTVHVRAKLSLDACHCRMYMLLACLLVPSVTGPEGLCERRSSWAAVTCMHTHTQTGR